MNIIIRVIRINSCNSYSTAKVLKTFKGLLYLLPVKGIILP